MIFRKLCVKWLKNHFYQKNHVFQKSNLTANIWMLASEPRAKYGIYVGNQKHPNLSTQTYGYSHVFKYEAYIEISGVKMRLNLIFQF